MENIKNKLKYFIVPVVLLFVVFLFVKQSYSLDELRETVTLSSEHTNYYNDEHNSWELQKSAYWINANEAEIKMEVHSNPYDGTISDYIFLIDLTNSDGLDMVYDFLYDYQPIDSNISILLYYGEFSDILVAQETDIDDVLDEIDAYNNVINDSVNVNVNYYTLLLNLENFLGHYTFNEEHSTKIIFVGYPYDGTTPHNQEEQFALIREEYPEVEFFFANTGDITTSGFLNSQVDYVGNDLELITSASVINDFVITDFIDTTYFEYEEIVESNYKYLAYQTCYWDYGNGPPSPKGGNRGSLNTCLPDSGGVRGVTKSSKKSRNRIDNLLDGDSTTSKLAMVNPGGDAVCVCVSSYYDVPTNTVVYDDETNKITWDLSDSIFSTNAVLRLKVRLKDEYVGSEEVFTTNESTRVVSNLNDVEEDVSTSDSPELKYYYTVTYDGNMPSGCSWTNVTETHSIYSTVDILESPPSCNGYSFYGWVSNNIDLSKPNYINDYTGEYNLYSGAFEMPAHNVTFKALWGKTGIEKTFDGDEYGLYSIYSISNVELNNAVELDSSEYTRKSTSTNVMLNSLDAIAKYTITAVNLSNKNYRIEVFDVSNNNPDVTYEIVEDNIALNNNSNTTFTLIIKYREGLTELPDNKSSNLIITYRFKHDGAMFDLGSLVNSKMRSIGYNATRIARYTDNPDNSLLIEDNLVSSFSSEYSDLIYMWYDEDSTTIYWYSIANNVYYNYDSNGFYANLEKIENISDLDSISTEYVNDMSYMFHRTGYNSSTFTLDLGDNFDTSNVINMESMFYEIAYNNQLFTLDLGDHFDTSNVTNMSYMFYSSAMHSKKFALDLGDQFDTSNVINMNHMFYNICDDNKSFEELDLGDKFYTNNVVNMDYMFADLANITKIYTTHDFSLNSLSNYNNNMFKYSYKLLGGAGTAYNYNSNGNALYAHIDGGVDNPGYFSLKEELDGAMFLSGPVVNSIMKQFIDPYINYNTDDSTITSIKRQTVSPSDEVLSTARKVSSPISENPIYMWYDSNTTTINWYSESEKVYYNYDSSAFYRGFTKLQSIQCINEIDASKAVNMSYMFYKTAYSSDSFELRLSNFDTSNVTNMSYMFDGLGFYNKVLVFNLGNEFDTSKVTTMNSMFSGIGSYYNVYSFPELDLGPKFDTSNVVDFDYMFSSSIALNTIYAPTSFVINNDASTRSMFYRLTDIAGGAGTHFNSENIDGSYAHIDGGINNPGYFTSREEFEGAMFKTGYMVNTHIKRLVNSNSFYGTTDSTITSIERYYNIPNSSYLNEKYIVSTLNSKYPIYMWYDSANTTIYWYTEASNVYYNSISSHLFSNLRKLNEIGNLDELKTDYLYNTDSMFVNTGYNSTTFTINLGSNFDTSNVVNMSRMFDGTGFSNPSFTLDLGSKFDTSNVTSMFGIFSRTGHSSTVFTINLGNKFNTSKVTDMRYMFDSAGYSNPNFALDLGDNFDTSNVKYMSYMFMNSGYNSTSFTLDLGDHFDTSNVTAMDSMFYQIGYRTASFTLDLGSKFDTSNVTNMSNMFNGAKGLRSIYVPTSFVTTAVTSSNNMFYGCTNLIGGAGTTFSTTNIGINYAHIDGGPSNPGYFSDRTNING